MDPFAQTVATWHDFYIMVGTASATLIGLLFVGLALNIEVIRRADAVDLQILGAQTFNSFFYILLFAVFFLIPDQTPAGLGLSLLGTGALGMLSMLLQYRQARKSRRPWGLAGVAGRIVTPIVALECVVIVAVSVLAGYTSGFYWLVPVMVLMLAIASRNAWDLLIGMRRAKPEQTPKD
jgi:hypothetical protein